MLNKYTIGTRAPLGDGELVLFFLSPELAGRVSLRASQPSMPSNLILGAVFPNAIYTLDSLAELPEIASRQRCELANEIAVSPIGYANIVAGVLFQRLGTVIGSDAWCSKETYEWL